MLFLVFMLIFVAICLGVFGFSIYRTIKLVKHPMPKTIDYPNEIRKLLYLIGATTISFFLILLFLSMWKGYQMNVGEWFELVIGSLLGGVMAPTFIISFILHYYAKEIPVKINKCLFWSVIGSGVLSLVALLLITNGIGDPANVSYPLVNGISFKEGFVTPKSVNSPTIAWYALCIIIGAVLVYFICDHRFYKEYGKHGILESTFFVAFPAGVIGARVGYVIGEWHKFKNQPWWEVFAIWHGGLTIISGALVGIIVGVLWFIWRNKKYSIWVAVDIILPAILIAQALGRWGNFFNQEVYGFATSESLWWFVPKMIMNNMKSITDSLEPGMVYMPLFYVEFLTNLIGYFVLRFAIGVGLKKYRELGDLAFGYLVWYGLTRLIMEPLRDSNYNMGANKYYSWIWAIAFVIGGTLAIFGNHLIRYLIRKKKNNDIVIKNTNLTKSISVSSCFFISSITMIVIGAVMMASNVQASKLVFDGFNNGLIILTIGIGLFLIGLCAYIYLYQVIKQKKYEREAI